ncbi:hypothetical protein C0Q70_07120 [Pomacea canaliculata]|uniref:Uncharacterized protein n=1 Tax=Pomacea canaliculata TaxID=400727 RepID=A0A2T7PE59_POMCA|nr:hypothetical protein C0Q70_07120 [Pomacea canaliculata]
MLAATSDNQPGDVSATAYCVGRADLATERRLSEGFLPFHRDTLCLCTSDHNLAGQERCLSYSRCQEIMGVGHYGLGQQQQEMAGGHTVQLPHNSADLDMLLLHPAQVGAPEDDCAFDYVRGEEMLSTGCDGCKDSPEASSTRQCSERESECGAFPCSSEDEWHRNATLARAADVRQMKATSFVVTQTLSSSTSCLSDTNLNADPLSPPVTCQMDVGLSRSVLKAAALVTASSNEQRGNRGAEDVGTSSRIEAPDSHASSEINNCMSHCVMPSRHATLFRQVDESRDKNTQAQCRVCPPRLWNVKKQREVTSTARVANCFEDYADGNRRWAAVAKTLMLIRSDSGTECSHSQVREINCPPTDFLHTEGERFRDRNTVAELEHWADENDNTPNFTSQTRFKRSFKDMQHLDGRQAPLFLHEAHRPICDSDTRSSQNVLLRCGQSVSSITFPAIVDLRSCDKPVDRRGNPSCFTSSSCSVYTQSGCQGQASWSSKRDLRPSRGVSAQKRTRETRPGVLGRQGDPLEVTKRHLMRLRCGNQSRLSLIKGSSFLRHRTVSLKSPSPKVSPCRRLPSANSVINNSASQASEDRQETQRSNQRMSVPRMYEVRSSGVQTEDIMICPSSHTSVVYREEKPESNNMCSLHVREGLETMDSSFNACAEPMASRSRSELRRAGHSSENCLRRYSFPCNQRSFASRGQCARLHRLGRRIRGLKRGPGVSLRTTCTDSAKAPFEHLERRQVSHRPSEVAHNRQAYDFSSATESHEENLGLRADKTGRTLYYPYYRNSIKDSMRNHSNNTVIPQAKTKVRNEELDGACERSKTAHYEHPPRTRSVLDDQSSRRPSVVHSARSRDCLEAEPDFDKVPCSSRAGPYRPSSSLVEPITTATTDDDDDDDYDETPSRKASVRLAKAGHTPGPQETRWNNTVRVCSQVYAHAGASDASVPKKMKASQRSLLTNRREYVGPFSGHGSTPCAEMDTWNTASVSTAWQKSCQDLPPRCAVRTIGDAGTSAADGSNDGGPRPGDSRGTACFQENSSKSKRIKKRKARLYHKARQLLRRMCHIKGKEEILFRAAIRLQRKRLEIQGETTSFKEVPF